MNDNPYASPQEQGAKWRHSPAYWLWRGRILRVGGTANVIAGFTNPPLCWYLGIPVQITTMVACLFVGFTTILQSEFNYHRYELELEKKLPQEAA